jgi:hypothetical protein
MYLACYPEILELLLPNLNEQEREEVLIAAWYEMILGGVKALRYYNVE